MYICKCGYEAEKKRSYLNHRRWCEGKMSRESYLGINLGIKNHQWKGDKASYIAIHVWARSKMSGSKVCTKCGSSKNIDTANISGKYIRDLSDWEYLCRSCHMRKDKRTHAGYVPITNGNGYFLVER